jgi:putative transposase
MTSTKCYRFRLDPTPEQERAFRTFAGCRRFVWNWALARKKETYHATGRAVSYHELAGELVGLKRRSDTAFLNECDSQALQQTLRDLDRAFVNFFEKRARYPKKKSRKKTPHAFRIPQRVTTDREHVHIPKIGRVKARLHREMYGVVKSATIKQAADRHWHVTFVCHSEQEAREPTCSSPAGIDVGLETFATFDDGEKVVPPRFYRKRERKIKRLHRRVSRCQKASRNRAKARKRLAAAYGKTRNCRNDWLHKLSLLIVSCHDTLCIEDLNLRGLVKTKLAKSFSDAALGTFRRMLEYKGLWYHCQIIKVDRFFASSKTCSVCGHQQHLELSDRVWICDRCGTLHDRDINAAKNILREGLRLVTDGQSETLTVCGEEVRRVTHPHSSLKQKEAAGL